MISGGGDMETYTDSTPWADFSIKLMMFAGEITNIADKIFENLNLEIIYCFKGFEATDYANENNIELRFFGDLDLNGSIEAVDITIMRKLLLNKDIEEIDMFDPITANVNFDEHINLKDLVKMKKMASGIS